MNLASFTEPIIGSPLVRSSLIVADLDRSLHFYRNLLGFTEEFASGVTRDPGVVALIGQPEGSLCRFAVIKRPGPAFGMIGLFEASEPRPPAGPATTAAVRCGDVFLVFYAKDLDPFVRAVEAAGGRMLVAPVEVVTKFRRYRELIACDPDGVRINLIERAPSEAWRIEGPGRVY